MYGFLLVFYSNCVHGTHCFWDVRLQKCRDLENQVKGPSRSLKMSLSLLTFPCNHGPISYHFWDRRRFQSKITKFHPHCILCPKGFPLELGTSAGGQKTRMMGLLSRQRNLTISSALWIQCTNVTDGRDRQTDTGQQQRPRLCIASRSKKALHCWFGNSLKRHTLASDPISMTLDLLNPKSIGFNM